MGAEIFVLLLIWETVEPIYMLQNDLQIGRK